MEQPSVVRVGLDRLDATWNPFQSQFWAKAKRFASWRAFAFDYSYASVDESESESTVVMVLVRRLVFGLRIAYVPFGPDQGACHRDAAEFTRDFARLVRSLLPKGTAFIRFDLPWGPPDDERVVPVVGKNLRTCKESVQPEATARIDLSDGYDAVRIRYRERARRNVRKAQAKSIVIEPWNGDPRTFEAWYSVYVDTAKRDGFTARSASYIRNFLDISASDVRSILYLARYGTTILGGAIILESRAVALYLYGASLRVDGCSPSYLLQDYAIREACSHGCKLYDLYGISGPQQRGSHLESLRLFKRAFGGYVCYRPQSFDYVYMHLSRFLYASFENVRFKIHRKRHPKRMSQQYSISTEE